MIYVFLACVLLPLGLYACDGFHQTRFQVEFAQSATDATAIVKMKEEDYKVAIQIIDDFAENHEMKCISCEEGKL
jgi:hypothetical protein